MELSVSNNNLNIVFDDSTAIAMPIEDIMIKYDSNKERISVTYERRATVIKYEDVTSPVFASYAELETWFKTYVIYIDISCCEYKQTLTFVPTIPICDGTITSATINTITDSTAALTVNELVDTVISIARNGQTQYGIVLSNTATVITFDCDLLWIPEVDDVYCHMDTLVLEADTANQLPILVASYPTDYSGAIILPEVISSIERERIDMYIEAIESDEEVIVICRGSQGVFSNQYKYVELVSDKETISLLTHFNTANVHYDIITTNNTIRYVTARLTADHLMLTNTDKQLIGTDAEVTVDFKKRFTTRTVDGIKWYEYNSLFEKLHQANLTMIINKDGSAGAGEVYIGWAKYTAATETITYLDLVGKSYFNNQDGQQTIPVQQPVTLAYGDRLCPYARREAGIITIISSSNIFIKDV